MSFPPRIPWTLLSAKKKLLGVCHVSCVECVEWEWHCSIYLVSFLIECLTTPAKIEWSDIHRRYRQNDYGTGEVSIFSFHMNIYFWLRDYFSLRSICVRTRQLRASANWSAPLQAFHNFAYSWQANWPRYTWTTATAILGLWQMPIFFCFDKSI